MRHLEPSTCAALTELVFIPDNLVTADVTIVLGMSLWRNPLEAALRLFRSGYAGQLLFTGGYNDRIGRPEGEVMAEAAVACGVPPALVICENQARHTRENFEFGWKAITTRRLTVRAVNVVGIHYHLRRAVLTARAVLPASLRIGHVSYASAHFGPTDWHACERGQRDVLREFAKLQAYFPDATPAGLMDRLR